MARHLSIRLTVDISINETDFELLKHLGSVAGDSTVGEIIPARLMAEALGVCPSTVRRSAKALAEQGLISCCDSRRPDGAREGNRYIVTRLGSEVLAIVSAAQTSVKPITALHAANPTNNVRPAAGKRTSKLNTRHKSEAML